MTTRTTPKLGVLPVSPPGLMRAHGAPSASFRCAGSCLTSRRTRTMPAADNGALKPRGAALMYACCQILSQALTKDVGELPHPRGGPARWSPSEDEARLVTLSIL